MNHVAITLRRATLDDLQGILDLLGRVPKIHQTI
jgi:hypothetical protein